MTIFLFQNDDPIDTIVLSKLRVSYLEPLLLLSQKQENNFEITLILEYKLQNYKFSFLITI